MSADKKEENNSLLNNTSTEKNHDKSIIDVKQPREKWRSKTEFLLSVAGGSIGLGNVWRFPYLAFKNGGGAFLIPYIIFVICGGIPIFFYEVAIGQYLSEGGITSWMRLAPITGGIGYASSVIVALLNIYYIVILAWAIFYLFQSLTSPELPWASCGHVWNTICCSDFIPNKNESFNYNNTFLDISNCTKIESPEQQYWQRRVLGLSKGLSDVGSIRWELALCLLVAWVVCYFCIWKGVKSSGKVVYFTATFPFLMLIVFVIRGVTLDGAMDGIKFYLTPNMTKLSEAQVWVDAGTQVFFSYTICLGAMISLGSYNEFNNNCLKDCIMLSILNSTTSFISGFAVFSVLGFMSKQQGRKIQEVASSGPGLAFITYPKAITMMPGSQLWAVLFFVMILLLGLDSQFVDTEGFITSVTDLFPKLRKETNRKIFIGVTGFLSYLIALSMVTNGGMYVFQLFDNYAASGFCLLWVAFFESIAISFIYGSERMMQNITRMIGYRPNIIIKYVLMFGTPLVTSTIFIFSLLKFESPTYNEYTYDKTGTAVGWCLAFSSMVVIPTFICFKLFTTPGTLKQRWNKLTTPALNENHQDYCKLLHCKKYSLKKRVLNGNFIENAKGFELSSKSQEPSVEVPPYTKSALESS